MKIGIYSKKQFDELEPDSETIAVRIIDPDKTKHSNISGYMDEIKLRFWDLEEPVGAKYLPIHQAQADELFLFLMNNKDAKRMVVHCMAGISRSNTVACYMAERILKDEALSCSLRSDTTKTINSAVWDALEYAHLKYDAGLGLI